MSREPGDESEVEQAETLTPAAERGFVEACQQLIREICASQDSNEKAMLHRQLTERLMRKR
jgi:hypothetical protein